MPNYQMDDQKGQECGESTTAQHSTMACRHSDVTSSSCELREDVFLAAIFAFCCEMFAQVMTVNVCVLCASRLCLALVSFAFWGNKYRLLFYGCTMAVQNSLLAVSGTFPELSVSVLDESFVGLVSLNFALDGPSWSKGIWMWRNHSVMVRWDKPNHWCQDLSQFTVLSAAHLCAWNRSEAHFSDWTARGTRYGQSKQCAHLKSDGEQDTLLHCFVATSLMVFTYYGIVFLAKVKYVAHNYYITSSNQLICLF